MPRRYNSSDNVKYVKKVCPLEIEIIEKIGDNRHDEKTFPTEIQMVCKDDGEIRMVYAFYTYKGDVCLLDSYGYDVIFTCYDERSRKRLHKAIMNNEYKKSK